MSNHGRQSAKDGSSWWRQLTAYMDLLTDKRRELNGLQITLAQHLARMSLGFCRESFEASQGTLAKRLDTTQPKISKSVAALREAGLLVTKPTAGRGVMSYYPQTGIGAGPTYPQTGISPMPDRESVPIPKPIYADTDKKRAPREKGKKSPTPPPRSSRSTREKGSQNGFDEFWELWPQKVAKKKALEAWAKLAPDKELQATIRRRLQEQIKKREQMEKPPYWPNPATWIDGERWEDEPFSETKKSGPTMGDLKADRRKLESRLNREAMKK